MHRSDHARPSAHAEVRRGVWRSSLGRRTVQGKRHLVREGFETCCATSTGIQLRATGSALEDQRSLLEVSEVTSVARLRLVHCTMRTLARDALFLLGGVIVAGLAILGLDIDEDDAASEGDCFERFEDDDLRVGRGKRRRLPKKDPGAVAAPAVVAPSVAEPEPMKRDVASSPGPQRVVTEPPATAAEKTEEVPSAEKTEEVPSAEKTELPVVAPRPETLPPVRAPAVTFADDASDASDEPVTPDDVDASAADVWRAASAAAAATPHQAASSAPAHCESPFIAPGGAVRRVRGEGGRGLTRAANGAAAPRVPSGVPRTPGPRPFPKTPGPTLPDSDDDDAEAPSTSPERAASPMEGVVLHASLEDLGRPPANSRYSTEQLDLELSDDDEGLADADENRVPKEDDALGGATPGTAFAKTYVAASVGRVEAIVQADTKREETAREYVDASERRVALRAKNAALR